MRASETFLGHGPQVGPAMGVVDRLPSRLRGYRSVAAQIGVSNCGDGPPEVIMILAIHHGDVGVCFRHGDECHKSCAIHDVHFPGHDQLARDRMVGHGSGNQPEPRIFGLAGGAPGACFAAEILDLVVVGSPLLAAQ